MQTRLLPACHSCVYRVCSFPLSERSLAIGGPAALQQGLAAAPKHMSFFGDEEMWETRTPRAPHLLPRSSGCNKTLFHLAERAQNNAAVGSTSEPTAAFMVIYFLLTYERAKKRAEKRGGILRPPPISSGFLAVRPCMAKPILKAFSFVDYQSINAIYYIVEKNERTFLIWRRCASCSTQLLADLPFLCGPGTLARPSAFVASARFHT